MFWLIASLISNAYLSLITIDKVNLQKHVTAILTFCLVKPS